MIPFNVRARLLAIIRARILTGVAEANGYNLDDYIDSLDAETDTDIIMAALFARRAASTPPQ